MLQLQINQQYAQIGLNIQKPMLDLRTTKPQIELDIKEPRVQIHSPRPEIYIDQSQCFADAGKRSPLEFSWYYSDIARSDAAAGIDRIVSEGDMLAAIENGTTIADVAAMAVEENVDFNVTAIPKQPPKIDWNIQPVQIELERGSVDLKLHRGHIENNFQPGKINVYLAQKNFIEINWVGENLNTRA